MAEATVEEGREPARTSLRSLYLLLAALDVITVLISFSLNVKLTNEFERSIAANSTWAVRLANYSELGSMIGAVNAPGNDVFDSRDVSHERLRMLNELERFNEKLRQSREEILALDADTQHTLLKDFETIDLSVKLMVEEAELIFSFFEKNDATSAGERMATMDRKFAIASANLAHLSQQVRVIQKNIFDEQLKLAKSLRNIEYLVLALVSLMIIGALRYGFYVSAAIKRSEAERRRLDIMKTEFVSSVSHELRTPLTSISGSLRIILSGSLGDISPPLAKKMLEIALKNSLRLEFLVNDLLDFGKITTGKFTFNMQESGLVSLIQQAIESSFSYCSERKVSIVFLNDENDFIVKVDPSRLTQVLLNLLSNAIKFSPENGEVTVSVKQLPQFVRVSVEDKGTGIPESFRQKIFQKFSQADASSTRKIGGTGLGLSISKALMEGMGGRIDYESIEGAGATFFIELPLLSSKE